MSSKEPQIGMGATIQMWSDRKSCTIVQITHDGKRLVIQRDNVVKIPHPTDPDQFKYEYQANPTGTLYYVTKRKDGSFRLMGNKTRVWIGSRTEYYDRDF